jgi:hypothetical protein
MWGIRATYMNERKDLMRADVADMIEDMRLMFEFEYCEECGGDFEDHDLMVVPGMGTLFAQCKA